MPEVSVIIPNYNHSKYLKQRIDSVLNQTYPHFELIILDDCSTDDSKAIIEVYRGHPKVKRIIYNNQNSGSTFIQWERGAQAAVARWLWIAESDDYAEPGFLEELVKLAQSDDNIGIAFCGSHWVDADGNIKDDLSLYHHSFKRSGTVEVGEEMVKHCTIQNASSCLFDRNKLLSSIKNLKTYRACGDWVLYVRMLQHCNLAFTSQKLNYFRWYHANISNAAKETLWITEGLDILSNINTRKVKISHEHFKWVINFWRNKLTPLSATEKFKATLKLKMFELDYWQSKLFF
ncbi:glycosyltransferase family 2 protein [Mucilaginibacter sp. CSA2-8R]|uniref:glycosyltransferase family 2 protein n=1 Tax=Mucilaginibacter sp. CSA2-8R TaxID=3141542 RepID=UPI00315CF62D